MGNVHNILITGAARGLGKYLARHFIEKKHSVFVLDIEPIKNLSDVYRKSIREYYEVDLNDMPAVEKIVDTIIKNYRRVDVLINNASVRDFRNFIDFESADISRYVNVNFEIPVMLIRKIYPIMKKHGYGRIINVSSKSAYHGYESGSLYCSTKNALATFTQAFGRELNSGNENVTVNALSPDSFSTIDGTYLKGCEILLKRIVKIVDDILVSDKNAEVFPVLFRSTGIFELLRVFKQRFLGNY